MASDDTEELEKLLEDQGFEVERLDTASVRKDPIWGCKIGIKSGASITLPGGSDLPMSRAVEEAFKKVTGVDAEFCFSGWGETLTDVEKRNA